MKKHLIIVLIAILVTPSAFAAGVNRISGLGTRAFSLGGAYTAVADDGSALYYNVAGLGQVEKNLFQVETELLAPKFSYERFNGQGQESEDAIFPMPTISFIHRLSDEKTVGGGIYTPYGMGASYPKTWRHGLVWRESLLSLANLTLGGSYKVNDKLYLGVGLDLGWGQLNYASAFHQIGNVVIDPLFVENKGHGFGLGYRLGLLWQPTEQLSVGLSYASPLCVKLKGKSDLNLFNLKFMEDEFKTEFIFPARLGLGVAWRPTPRLLWSTDIIRYDYSRSDKLTFDFARLPNLSQKLNWQSMFAVHTGVEYQLTPKMYVRAGIGWQDAVIPKTTTNPIVLDAPGFVYTVGFGYSKNDWTLDVGYGIVDAGRTVEKKPRNLAPGKYRANINVLSVAVGYKF